MKNVSHLFAALLIIQALIIPALVIAAPKAETDLSKVSEPPADAPTGKELDGVQIGLWTEKTVYKGNEIRNVWRLARNDRSSGITIGVGGSLFKNSVLYITAANKEVTRIPMGGGIDGIVNPTRTSGGLSGHLEMLPAGTYQLNWKTETHKSNTITIEIKNGEQVTGDQAAAAGDSKAK